MLDYETSSEAYVSPLTSISNDYLDLGTEGVVAILSQALQLAPMLGVGAANDRLVKLLGEMSGAIRQQAERFRQLSTEERETVDQFATLSGRAVMLADAIERVTEVLCRFAIDRDPALLEACSEWLIRHEGGVWHRDE